MQRVHTANASLEDEDDDDGGGGGGGYRIVLCVAVCPVAGSLLHAAAASG